MKIEVSKLDYGRPTRVIPVPGETGQSDRFYKLASWYKVRKLYLSKPENVFCRIYENLGIFRDAKVVDHVIRRSTGGSPYDPRNFMPMCDLAHNIKRAMEGNGEFDDLVPYVDYEDDGRGKYPTQEYRDMVIQKIAKHIKERWLNEDAENYL